ncbi:MAG: Lon-like protease helical domain-containing protein, partial [Myxococcota bacterium]|nr:Lon-like protease helical domain-containing protein [Myxococcota bacterium]
MSENLPALTADQLRKKIDPEALSFRCTASLSASEVIIGQEIALKAIRRAVGMDGPGFNLFAVGLAATGRQATVRRIFDELRPRRRKRRDFVFVQNLENPARPRLIVLPVGRGDELKNQLRDLRARLPQAIKYALEQEVVRKARDMATLQQEIDTRSAYGDLDELVREAGLVLGSVGEGAEARPALFYAVEEQMLTRAALRVAVERGEVVLEREVDEIAAAFDQLSGVVAETVVAMAE